MSYGCHNRAPLRDSRVVADGWFLIDANLGKKRFTRIADPMTKDCNYTHTELGQGDAGCYGCKWRADGSAAEHDGGAHGVSA